MLLISIASSSAAYLAGASSRVLGAPRAGGARRCAVRCSADSADEFSFASLRAEAERRGRSDGLFGGEDLGKFDRLRKEGPHDRTSPRQVVEHVLTEMREGDLQQAFDFTSCPPWRQGTHKSSSDWSQRMDWAHSKTIEGVPSGRTCALADFEGLVKSRCAPARNFYGAHFGAQFSDAARRRRRYAALLQTKAYRFVGDDSAWQQKGGLEQMTAPKEYVVEVQAGAKEEGQRPEHLLVRFELTYDWLVYCHLVSTVSVTALSTERYFPGSDDSPLFDM